MSNNLLHEISLVKGESTEHMNKNIAVFNNTTDVAEIKKPLFEREGYNMIKASTLEKLLSLIRYDNIHLILVELELEGSGLRKGIEIIQHIRKSTIIPIIVVSAQTAETAKIMSLNVGADDYVTVYDSPLVLLARVKAQLRRYTELKTLCENLGNIYRIGDLVLDDKNKTVMVDDKNIKMTPVEYKILRLLIRDPGRVFSINQIYEEIWKMQPIGAENVIAVRIRHIREKIENNPREPKYVKVVRGLGYKAG